MKKDDVTIAQELSSEGWALEWKRNRFGKFRRFYLSVKWRARDLYWEVRNFPKFVKHVWEYLPILYRDRDYDYSSMLEMTAYKCKRMRVYIEKYGHLESGEKVCKELRFAEILIDRILEDDYCSKESEDLDRQYGSMTLLSRKASDDNDITAGCKEILFTRERCASDPKLIEKEKEENRRIRDKAEKLKQYDYDLLFKHLRKRIQRWWD